MSYSGIKVLANFREDTLSEIAIMEIIKTSLIGFVVCVAYASAFGGFRGQIGPEVNASTIWVNKPVDDKSHPRFAPVSDENNGEGLTLSDYCNYVVENKATPWPCPEQTETEEDNGRRPPKPTIEDITQFCTTLVSNNYMFRVPAGRGYRQGERMAKRNIDKTPGF